MLESSVRPAGKLYSLPQQVSLLWYFGMIYSFSLAFFIRYQILWKGAMSHKCGRDWRCDLVAQFLSCDQFWWSRLMKDEWLDKCRHTFRYISDPTRENQPNCPKAFLLVGSFKEKKGNNSRIPKPIFLKFRDIVHKCKCQLFMWSVNFSHAKKTIKSSSENGGNFINQNWFVQKILLYFSPLIFNVLIMSILTFHFPYVNLQGFSIVKCISPS